MFLVPVLITITCTVILSRKTPLVMNAFMLQEIVQYKRAWRMSVNAWEWICSLTIIILGSLACINAQRMYYTNCPTASNEFLATPEAWEHVLIGITCYLVSHIGFGRSLTLDSFWRSTGWARSRWHDVLTLLILVTRMIGYNLLVFFWVQKHFYIAMCLVFALCLTRVIYNSLEKPFGEVWEETYRIIYDEATEQAKDVPKELESRTDSFGNHATRSFAVSGPTDERLSTVVKPRNVYMDLTQKFGIKVVTIFCGQWMVLVAFVFGMKTNIFEFMCHHTKWSLNNWNMFFCVLVVQFLMCTAMGSSFMDTLFDWYLVLDAAKEQNMEIAHTGEENKDWKAAVNISWVKCQKRSGKLKLKQPTNHSDRQHLFNVMIRPYAKLRFLMDFMANGVVYMFLILAVPVALFNDSDSMDWAKDCVAIGFITVCDDLQDEDGRSMLRLIIPNIDKFGGHTNDFQQNNTNRISESKELP